MRRTEGRVLCERDGQTVTHAAVGEEQRRAVGRTFHADWWQQKRDRRARANDIAQPNTTIGTRRKVARATGSHVVTNDTDPPHVVMEPLERGARQLRQTLRNETTRVRQCFSQTSLQTDVDAVGQEVAPTKLLCVSNEAVYREADRGIVSRDNCSRARSHDDVDPNIVVDELLQHADMAGAAQAPTAQHETDPNFLILRRHDTMPLLSTAPEVSRAHAERVRSSFLVSRDPSRPINVSAAASIR